MAELPLIVILLWARYVIMSDHIHLFVQGDPKFDLGRWIGGLKRVVAAAVTGGRSGLRSAVSSIT
jgi:REP element-mobilizing transposase RayT